MYELTASDTEVNLWSDVRLPFEPKGEVLAMRNELRAATRKLRGPSLFAAFSGPEGATLDLENVLFYNVGCSGFAGCGGERVRFERKYRSGGAPGGPTRTWHHRYSTEQPESSWLAAGPGWAVQLAGSGTLPASAAAFWALTHRANRETEPPLPAGPLSHQLRFIARRQRNLTEVVKRVIDGLLSALHEYDGDALEAVAERAALATGMPADEAAARLAATGPLGKRRFVWPFRNGLQWSPADDRLVSVDVHQSVVATPGWSLRAELRSAVRR
jgi:hypothetical protein